MQPTFRPAAIGGFVCLDRTIVGPSANELGDSLGNSQKVTERRCVSRLGRLSDVCIMNCLADGSSTYFGDTLLKSLPDPLISSSIPEFASLFHHN
jgi:hypothetical protein